MVNLEGNVILFQTQNPQDIKEKVDKIVEAAGFDQVGKMSFYQYSFQNTKNLNGSIKHADTSVKVIQFNLL